MGAALIPALIKKEGDYDARRIIDRAELYKQLDTGSASLNQVEKEQKNRK